jgi:hypothetical protein
VLNYLRCKTLVFLLRVLFVEDAVLLVPESGTSKEVMAGVCRVAVEKTVIAVAASVAEITRESRIGARAALKIPLAFHGDEGTIHGGDEPGHRFTAEDASFRVVNVETGSAVLAVPEVIPAAVLHLDVLIRSVNGGQLQLPELFFEVTEEGGTRERLYFFIVLFLRELLILVAVLLVPEVTAEEAVLDADAIVEERGERAIRAEFGGEELIAIGAVDAFVAEFDFFAVTVIHAVPTLDDFSAIQTTFRAHCGKNEIAVLVFDGNVRVIAVLIIEDIDAKTRYVLLEFRELFEERSTEVKWPSACRRIPAVAEVARGAVDGEGFIRSVDGNCLLLA